MPNTKPCYIYGGIQQMTQSISRLFINLIAHLATVQARRSSIRPLDTTLELLYAISGIVRIC
jgi:hypothetical protein